MSPARYGLLADRYQLDERIAVGGFGEVWRSTDTLLARPVAVKLLQSGNAQEPGTVARFRAEAQHAGSLTHQGIARVYDYGEPAPPQPPFLVLELVDGPSLAALLARGPLGPVQAMDVVAQTAAGLHAAHQTGLVHRDIKPGNLLIGPGGVVKITDFGISHAAGTAPLTDAGHLVGTAGYLAPERAVGHHGSAASDLYSLGIVTYECLAGRLPFTGGPLQVALAHLDRPMPPLPAGVPADVADLVSRLTAKDPDQRPGTAGEVAEEAAWLRDRLIVAADGLTGDPGYASVAPPPWPHTELPHVGPPGSDAWPTGPQPAVLPPARPRRTDAARPGGRSRGWRLTGLAGFGAAAALLAVSLTGLASPVKRHHPAAVPSSTSAPHASKAALVRVRAAVLTGQPVSTVRSELRQLGLAVQVQWQPAQGGAPGTVRSVHPAGWLPAGSTVMVAGVLPPTSGGADHHHHADRPPRHNQGQNQGQDQGPGQGNGKGKHHGRSSGQGQGGQPPEGGTSLAAVGTQGAAE